MSAPTGLSPDSHRRMHSHPGKCTVMSSGRGGQMPPGDVLQQQRAGKSLMMTSDPAEHKDPSDINKMATTTQGPVGKRLVEGEQKESVSVQSQVASATMPSQPASPRTRTNLDEVVNTLSSQHAASLDPLESESRRINEWGQAEIKKILDATKEKEEGFVANARMKQKQIEDEHKTKLSRVIQELDVSKAGQLKELEDTLQRTLQTELNRSRQQIDLIEKEMNRKKQELLASESERLRGAAVPLSQQQQQTAQPQLGEMVVEASLQPSSTKTLVETRTDTAPIRAINAGGASSAAPSSSLSFHPVEAVPIGGTLKHDGERIDGDIVRRLDRTKIGEGSILQSQAKVVTDPVPSSLAGGARSSSGNDEGIVAEQQRKDAGRSIEPIEARHIQLESGDTISGGNLGQSNMSGVGGSSVLQTGAGAAPGSRPPISSHAAGQRIDAAYGKQV